MTTSGATAVQIVHSSYQGSRDIEHLGSARDEVELEAAEALGMFRRPSTGRSASTGIVAPAGAGQAQARAGAERAIVMYQYPPPRFSAPRTRKKAAHP